MKKLLEKGLSVAAAAVFATSCMGSAVSAASKPVSFNNGSASAYGNEADFIQVSSDDKNFSNSVVVENGKEYVVRMYIHNNSGDKGPASVKAKAAVSGLNGTGSNVTLTGKISADNASTVTDTASFKATDGYTIASLNYKAGTAQYYTGYNGGSFFNLGTELFNDGALLGYSKMDGSIPSCYEYSGWLSFRVTATVNSTAKVNPNFTIDKTVQIFTNDNNKTFVDDEAKLNVKAGDTLRYAIHFKNTGDTNLTKVTVRDTLPEYLEYVKGSTEIKVGSTTTYTKVADGITTDGLTIYASGTEKPMTFLPDSGMWILFKVTVKPSVKDIKCGTSAVLKNIVRADAAYNDVNGAEKAVGEKWDTVSVSAKAASCPVEETEEEIVNTGMDATNIVTSAIGAGSVVTALGLYIASRKKLM